MINVAMAKISCLLYFGLNYYSDEYIICNAAG